MVYFSYTLIQHALSKPSFRSTFLIKLKVGFYFAPSGASLQEPVFMSTFFSGKNNLNREKRVRNVRSILGQTPITH